MEAKADTPIELASMDKLTDDELDILLTQMRERRLRPVREYEEMLALRGEALKEQLETQYDKQLEMFKKELDRVDKALDKIEARAINLKALKMQMGQ